MSAECPACGTVARREARRLDVASRRVVQCATPDCLLVFAVGPVAGIGPEAPPEAGSGRDSMASLCEALPEIVRGGSRLLLLSGESAAADGLASAGFQVAGIVEEGPFARGAGSLLAARSFDFLVIGTLLEECARPLELLQELVAGLGPERGLIIHVPRLEIAGSDWRRGLSRPRRSSARRFFGLFSTTRLLQRGGYVLEDWVIEERCLTLRARPAAPVGQPPSEA